jgi:hypothetical protein
MPFTKCPLCGDINHINVSADWYEKYHPNSSRGSLVAGRCFYCWQEIKTGDAVIIRTPSEANPSVQPGECGIVQEILAEPDGPPYSVYLVRLASGKELYFTRAEVRKPRESEK